jgi:hypothetical protein
MVGGIEWKALDRGVATTADLYLENHRRQLMLLGAGLAALLVLGIFPTTERALFLETGRLAPKVFAVLPKPTAELASFLDFTRQPRSAFLTRLRRPLGAPAGVGDVGPAGTPDVAPLTSPEGLVPLGATPLGNLASAGEPARNFQNSPLAGASLPQFSPAGAADSVSNPVGPVNPVDPVTPVIPGDPGPVGAVPEPATWLTMIMGFFVMGAALRSRRGRASIKLQTVSG